MTKTLMTALATVATLAGDAVAMAADLQASGAIRPDHEQKFSGLRVQLDQLAGLATDCHTLTEATQPENPDAAAFERLAERVTELTERTETLALTVDHLADKMDAEKEAG
jgi:hypothetical protein